jgi:molecular chaperone GrpE (heat shock protein)
LKKDQLNSHYHEAVDKVINAELPANSILEVVKKGYLLHNQVLKASQVKISQKAE